MEGLNCATANDVLQAARRHLVDNIGNRAVAGMPRFADDTQTWSVAVSCATDRGVLPAGTLQFDGAGRLVSAPSRETLEQVAEALYQRVPLLVYGERQQAEAAGLECVTV